MKKRFVLLLIGLAGCAAHHGATRPDGMKTDFQVRDGQCEKIFSFDEMVRGLADADVVFMGEIHTDSLTHVLELKLLKALYEQDASLAVAFEMFERDVQPDLNAYLAGEIGEESFLETSRPWKNYNSAYRPLVEYAREKALPVLAMNVPRRYAGRVAMRGGGALAALPDSEKVWVAREFKFLDDEYKSRFIDLMTQDTPDSMMHINMENVYKAQVIKDDTMAESIFLFLQDHPGVRVVSYQGDFHSAFGLGIVKKLRLMNSDLNLKVISAVPVEKMKPKTFREYAGQGDYLIFVPAKE